MIFDKIRENIDILNLIKKLLFNKIGGSIQKYFYCFCRKTLLYHFVKLFHLPISYYLFFRKEKITGKNAKINHK